MVDTTFPDFKSNYTNIEYLKSRAILATTNEIVDEINDYMPNLVPSIEKEYYSADSISKE